MMDVLGIEGCELLARLARRADGFGHTGCAKVFHFIPGVAEPAQNFVGVHAGFRRRAPQLSRLAGEVEGRRNQAGIAKNRSLDRGADPEVPDLRILEYLVDGIDGPGRYARLFEDVDPVRRRFVPGY